MRRVTRTGTRLIDPERTTGPEDPSTSSYLNRRFFRFDRKLAYPETTDTGEWQRWHRKLRRALYKTLCLDRLGAVPTPTSRVLETVQCEGYRREKLAYEVLPGDWVSAYLLIPDGKERGPAVICPHGHVEGAKENVVGIARPKGVAMRMNSPGAAWSLSLRTMQGWVNGVSERIRKDTCPSQGVT